MTPQFCVINTKILSKSCGVVGVHRQENGFKCVFSTPREILSHVIMGSKNWSPQLRWSPQIRCVNGRMSPHLRICTRTHTHTHTQTQTHTHTHLSIVPHSVAHVAHVFRVAHVTLFFENRIKFVFCP